MQVNGRSRAPLVTISEVAPDVEIQSNEQEETHLSIPNEKNHIDRTFQRKESLLSSTLSLYVQKVKPKIPDGGWGWLVVLASFFINMISDGVGYTFGLLYVEFLHEFKASKSATSWIGSLFMAIPLIAGPLGSVLVDRYGCQYMTIIGGVICTIGLMMSSYVKTIGVMYLTFGFIGGLGQCLCFVTAVVSIAFWFDKKRTIAMSLAASGTGFGTAAYSPLATYLFYEFGWRGTILITAGIFANICVCGALMRDPDWIIEEEEEEKHSSSRRRNGSSSHSFCIEDIKDALETGKDTHYLLEDLDATLSNMKDKRVSSSIDLPTFFKQNEKVPLEVLQHLSENKRIYSIILENYPNLLHFRSVSDKGLNMLPPAEGATASGTRVPIKFSMKLKKDVPENSKDLPLDDDVFIEESSETKPSKKGKNKLDEDGRPTRTLLSKMRNPIQQHAYLRNIRFRKNSICYKGALLNIHKYKMKASSCPDIFRNSMATFPKDEEPTWYEEFVEILKDMTNFSLFLELHFFLFCLSTIVLCIWFVVPYFYLADHMKMLGYEDKETAYVFSIIGITNTVGMLVLGWLGDKTNVAKFVAVCLILCGTTVAATIFFASNYVLLCISAGSFGFFFASCLSLTPSLLAELVSLDDFTMAYGLILLCEGIGNLTGPPVAGLLYDLTGSYDQSFYQSAFWIVVSGVLVGIIPYTKNRIMFGNGKLSIEKANDDED